MPSMNLTPKKGHNPLSFWGVEWDSWEIHFNEKSVRGDKHEALEVSVQTCLSDTWHLRGFAGFVAQHIK